MGLGKIGIKIPLHTHRRRPQTPPTSWHLTANGCYGRVSDRGRGPWGPGWGPSFIFNLLMILSTANNKPRWQWQGRKPPANNGKQTARPKC